MRTLFAVISIIALASPSAFSREVLDFLSNQFKKTNPLFGYVVGAGTPKMNRPILRTFSTDGCSLSPNSMAGMGVLTWGDKKEVPQNGNFAECCVQHDVAYWLGGTKEEKDASDEALRQCIEQKAGKYTADTYFVGVQTGGGPNALNTFRWGYGWDSPRPYSKITPDEQAQAENLYGKDIHLLKEMVAQKKYQIKLELVTFDFAGTNRWFEDKLVYYFLQNKLRRKDEVIFGQKLSLSGSDLFYVVRLKGCPGNVISIKFNSLEFFRDALRYFKEIDQMSWTSIEKYFDFEKTQDPGKCLDKI